MKNWYEIKNRSDNVIDISLHDEIGLWGISAADFISDLRAHDALSINLSIHSPGGSVLDGLAIYNALVAHPAKVHGHVEGIAASAASFVLMAADTISMPEDAFIMIHNAHGGAMGDADDLREMADIIEKLQNAILNIYERRTGADRETIAEMMKIETWMTAGEALENGFIDTITSAMNVAAKVNVFNKYFKSMPVKALTDVEDIKTISDFERYLRDVGNLSNRLATSLTGRAKEVFGGEPREPLDELNKLSAALDKVKVPSQISR